MSKKFMISIISLFLVGVLGIVGYHTYDFLKYTNSVDKEFDSSVKESSKLLEEEKLELEKAQKQLNNIQKYSIMYGFFYSPKIEKIVQKEYKIPKSKYTFDTIFNTLKSEDFSEVDNFYDKIKVNKFDASNGLANIDISFKGWDKLSPNDKYYSLKSLLWTMYSSTNYEMINLTIDGQIIEIEGRTPYDIYNRSYVNPLNDNERYNDDEYNNFMYMPITHEFKDKFYYIETNITNDDSEMRLVLDTIGKKYNMPIKSIENQTDPMYQMLKYSIILENETYKAGFGGPDTQLIDDLSKAFKLTIPFKHYLVINEEVQPNPVFRHTSYKNNSIIK